ncbi:MAG TPA: TonB-dependent receptor [Bacteroidales bacterium]|nr:TonB-dependent receptor [Bacteroidales bacterium]
MNIVSGKLRIIFVCNLIFGMTALPAFSQIKIDSVIVTGYLKGGILEEQLVPISKINLQKLENENVTALKGLSGSAPNFYIPDYGSRMTSSVYLRGIGARIDNPVIGLYVDGIPYLNKNNFDFDFFDIRSVDILRGPQSSLFGRNTIGGVVNITTLSPFAYQGTKASIGYGNGNSFSIQASQYSKCNDRLGISAGAYYNSSDGFYTNDFSHNDLDWYKGGGVRLRLQWIKSADLSFDNSFTIGYLEQGGFPYGKVDTLTWSASNPNYNDKSGYKRFTVSEGVSFKKNLDKYILTGIISYQYTDDKMNMDQDYTPDSYFSLIQNQKEHTIYQDIVLRSKEDNRWKWLNGASCFFKYLDMDAPVTFKEDGIDRLILANANKGLSLMFPGEEIKIKEENFVINSFFKIPTYGVALYHHSFFRYGKWLFEAGLRLDCEGSHLRYDNGADIHYLFTMTMSEYREIVTKLKGNENLLFIEILPRVAASYNTGNYKIFSSLARGYKAGGYNTQLFSDILQNQMMEDMMNDLGVHLTNSAYSAYNIADVITYKPEYCLDFELGVIYSSNTGFNFNLLFFDIICTNQQLTIFPERNSTGRMMTNAGKTRSYGVEGSISYNWKNLKLYGDYGYTDARFIKYNNGRNDFSGKYVPYAPQQTVSAGVDYTILAKNNQLLPDKIVIHADVKGFGKIYWNETNTLSQNFYTLLNGSISLQKKPFTLELWGKNLLSSDYSTFYFLSMGNSFLQKGKPLQYGLKFKINI